MHVQVHVKERTDTCTDACTDVLKTMVRNIHAFQTLWSECSKAGPKTLGSLKIFWTPRIHSRGRSHFFPPHILQQTKKECTNLSIHASVYIYFFIHPFIDIFMHLCIYIYVYLYHISVSIYT